MAAVLLRKQSRDQLWIVIVAKLPLEAENVRLADEKQRAATVAEIETIGRDLKKAAAENDISTTTAMEDCVITSITKDAMIAAIHDEPKFSEMFMTYLTAAPPLPKPHLVKVALGIGGI